MSDRITDLNVQLSEAVKQQELQQQELVAAKHEAVILTAPGN